MVSVISSPLQAILWDVDGTLAETERDGHRLAFNAAFGEASIPLHWDAEEYGAWLAITGGKERIAAALQQLRGKAPAPEELARLQAAQSSPQRHGHNPHLCPRALHRRTTWSTVLWINGSRGGR